MNERNADGGRDIVGFSVIAFTTRQSEVVFSFFHSAILIYLMMMKVGALCVVVVVCLSIVAANASPLAPFCSPLPGLVLPPPSSTSFLLFIMKRIYSV